jgi:hypothetical protein
VPAYFVRNTRKTERGVVLVLVPLVVRTALLGRCDETLDALDTNSTVTLTHDQYQLTINRAWVDERLKSPFERK